MLTVPVPQFGGSAFQNIGWSLKGRVREGVLIKRAHLQIKEYLMCGYTRSPSTTSAGAMSSGVTRSYFLLSLRVQVKVRLLLVTESHIRSLPLTGCSASPVLSTHPPQSSHCCQSCCRSVPGSLRKCPASHTLGKNEWVCDQQWALEHIVQG